MFSVREVIPSCAGSALLSQAEPQSLLSHSSSAPLQLIVLLGSDVGLKRSESEIEKSSELRPLCSSLKIKLPF